MINSYDVFLFDFDGTLFDTYESSIYVFEEAYARKGIKINREEILGYTREPIPASYKRITGSMDGFAEFIADIDELVFSDKVTQMAEIYGDTAEILKLLKANKKTVGIVTSNAKDHVVDVLKRFDLVDYFDVIVGNKEAPTPKPSPEPILKALELLRIKDKNKVVYIGDSLNDALAAKNAKIKPILLDRLNEFRHIEEYEVISSLEDIVR